MSSSHDLVKFSTAMYCLVPVLLANNSSTTAGGVDRTSRSLELVWLVLI